MAWDLSRHAKLDSRHLLQNLQSVQAPLLSAMGLFVSGASGGGSGVAFTGLRGPATSSRAKRNRPCSTQPRMPGSQRAPTTFWHTPLSSCGQDQELMSTL